MRGFRDRSAVEAVVALVEGRVGRLNAEEVDLGDASGRVLAVDVSRGRPMIGAEVLQSEGDAAPMVRADPGAGPARGGGPRRVSRLEAMLAGGAG